MSAADPVPCAGRLRLLAEAIEGLAARLARTEPDSRRRRPLLWLRVLAEDLLAELGGVGWAEFDLPALIDQTVRRSVSESVRPDLLVALVADDPLPRRVWGEQGRLARLLKGLLAGAIEAAGARAILLEVTVTREDEEWAEVRFLAGEDFARLGARSPARIATVDPAEGERSASLTGVGVEDADPTALWFALRFRKAQPESLGAANSSCCARTAASEGHRPLEG